MRQPPYWFQPSASTRPGFHSNHRRSRLPHHIMPEMPSPVTVAAGDTEIVIVAVGKVFR